AGLKKRRQKFSQPAAREHGFDIRVGVHDMDLRAGDGAARRIHDRAAERSGDGLRAQHWQRTQGQRKKSGTTASHHDTPLCVCSLHWAGEESTASWVRDIEVNVLAMGSCTIINLEVYNTSRKETPCPKPFPPWKRTGANCSALSVISRTCA